MLLRFSCLVLPLLLAGCAGAVSSGYERDFDGAWSFVRDHYCFFPDTPDEWNRAGEALRPRAMRATTQHEFIKVLEDLLHQIADPHSHLRVNLASSNRLVPHDAWGVRGQDGLRIEAVRQDSNAERAGVRPGDTVTHIKGERAIDVADAHRPKFSPMPGENLDQYSALLALAGTHDTPRTWTVQAPSGEIRTVEVDAVSEEVTGDEEESLISGAELHPDVGYVRIASFGDLNIVRQFDEALDRVMDKPALIIDVRNNRGGDTAVARPIMGRFVQERTAYATMRRRDGDTLGEPWSEYVEPRGTAYAGRVIVLVDRFSASMAEGVAMGMRTIADARIVGTRMAGLGAAIGTHTLPESNITFQISTEPVYTVDGMPRWTIVPDVEVSVEALRADPAAILNEGLREARQK